MANQFEKLDMTLKHLNTCLIISLFLLLTACGNDDCPEVVRPTPFTLSKVQQDRFPYTDFNTLTYLVEGDKDAEIVRLNKTSSGYRSVYTMASRDEDGRCAPQIVSIRENHYVIFEPEDGDMRKTLTFKNKESSSLMSVHFGDSDSISIAHGFLNRLIGEQNEIPFTDTVKFRDTIYAGAKRRYFSSPEPTNYIFQIGTGFVHMRDETTRQQWTLIEAK